MKVKSLPMGPKEVSGSWYAHIRLGFNTLIYCCWWGCGINGCKEEGAVQKLNHITLTRVMEKLALLSCDLVHRMIKDVFADSLASGNIYTLWPLEKIIMLSKMPTEKQMPRFLPRSFGTQES